MNVNARNMVIGVGTDLIEVARIAQTLRVYGERFEQRVFDPAEIAYCRRTPRRTAERYAARFAAKEAFSKAMGTGIARGVRWRDIVVGKLPSGKPYIDARGTTANGCRGLSFELSLTHTDHLAMATVIIQRDTDQLTVDRTLQQTSAIDTGALLEFSRRLNALDDQSAIYNNVLLALMGRMGLAGAAVAVANAAGDGGMTISIAKGGLSRLLGLQIPACAGRSGALIALADMDSDTRDIIEPSGVQRLMPIVYGETTEAILLLGGSLTGRQFGDSEETWVQLVGAITAIAIDACRARGSLNEANRRLERRTHRLRSLFEAGREFNALLDPDAVLRLLGYSLMGEMAIGRFAVALQIGEIIALVQNRFPEDVSSDVLQDVCAWGPRVLLEEDADEAAVDALWRIGVRATIPMDVGGRRLGLLLVGPRIHAPTDEEDLEYLCSLANLAIGALENMRLVKDTIVRQRLEEDLRIAAEIQQGLLPNTLPLLRGYEFAARTIPTHQVGGDCYDAIELDDGRILFSIADVSGKGTPASLLMAGIQSAVRALAGLGLPLDDMVARVNDLIYRNTAADRFVTAFFGVLDPVTSVFIYVNAGHNPPFHLSHRGLEELRDGGVILGIMPSIVPWQVGRVIIEPDDYLTLYTDGVSEALDGSRQEYGEERLGSAIRKAYGSTVASALDDLYNDVVDFTRGAPQSDDITILMLHRLAG